MTNPAWETALIDECLDPAVSFPTGARIQTRDYGKAGRFPIIDQGQTLIAGWTDSEADVIGEHLPVVVFGDHTRALKYADFPFVRGADGTQILKPRSHIDPLFFFFACRALELPSRGYNRHFRFLRQQTISLPPSAAEQRQVGQILRLVEDRIAALAVLIEQTSALKGAAMRQLFTYGLRGEEQQQTPAGLAPGSWTIGTLGEVADLERGRFLHRPRNEPRFYNGPTPFIQTGDVVRSKGRIRTFTQSLNEDGLAISRVFPKGTILITIAANIGYTGVLEMNAACPDSLIGIRPKESLNVHFLEYYLQTQQAEMDRLAPKGTQKNINIQFLEPWPVIFPPDPQEQGEIVEILDAIDQKIDLHRRKKAVLEELFRALLHKLMTGEIRVADLNLSALDGPAAEAKS